MGIRIFRTILLAGLMLWAAPALAQAPVIGQVVIEGLQRVDESAVREVIQVEAGDPVDRAAVDRDLHAIFGLGRFRDVRARLDEGAGFQVLVYQVEERPLVRNIEFRGNDEIEESKLKEVSQLRTPDLLDPMKLQAAEKALRAAYVEEGYYNADIETLVETGERNEATLIFDITEGEKVLISEIRFEGNTVFSDRELRKSMETRERWFLSWLTDRGTYREEVLANDLEILADKYYDQGYVQVRVKQPLVELSENRKSLEILIEIEEGEQFRVGEIDVRGDLIQPRPDLLGTLKLQSGEVFSRSKLREDVFTLSDLYADRGYAYVNVAPLTKVDAENRLIDLVFEIEQGLQVRIERIEIAGNTRTRDKVIRREMQLAEGDLYSSSKLKESRRKVKNLGYFDEVNVTTAKGSDEEHINLDVEVTERPTGTFSLGFGYSSVDKFIGQGSVSQDNFLGRGLKLNLAGSFGGTSTTYQVGLVEPYFLDTRLTLGFDLYKTRREWSDFTKETLGGDIKVGYPLFKNSRIFSIYRYEEKEISDVDENASLIIREQEGKSTISSILTTLTRDTTDYRLDPSTGGIAELSVEFAGLGGTEKFAKTIVDYRHFFPLFWDTVFSVHGQVGYIQEVGGKEIPIDERFFLGGLRTLRGFGNREVGPRDAETGDFTGGDKEAFFNVEYIFPIIKDMGLKGVAFFDTGNAWGDGEEFFSDMRYSVGGGIRWFSPMGPLRLEWGYNLDPKDYEDNSQFEFSIGKFF